MRLRILTLTALLGTLALAQPARWTEQKANAWYARQPWLVGANYNPASAINQLEMWQADTFNPAEIDRELGWAASIGMNTMRVFLHDLPWQQDAKGYRQRINQFLQIAAKHRIRPMLVLFDSVWDPGPQFGKQRAPKPGVHNSGWVQGPGAKALMDPAQEARLETYVKGVVTAFAKDGRVLAWDLWNEPDNLNGSSYGQQEPKGKIARVQDLLPKVAAWARSANPQQPLTVGVWQGDWSAPEKMSPIDRLMVELSDVVSFHNYENAASFTQKIQQLRRYNRPLLCTEYLARSRQSTFQDILPIAKREKVAAINWGLVQGKTQTHLPWDSWQKPYTNGREPDVWHHEVFRPDGTPYRKEEVEFIRQITGKAKAKGKAA